MFAVAFTFGHDDGPPGQLVFRSIYSFRDEIKMSHKVTTRIERPKEVGCHQDWEELIAHFGNGGEPVKYERRVFDPDYPDGCLTELTPAAYARHWAFIQQKLATIQGITVKVL